MTGLIIFLGHTPVFHMSKHQGAIKSPSSYSVEFVAMRIAVVGILGDNKSIILHFTTPSSHVAISYHKTREATATGIVH